jgi:hypothetical protein
MVSILPCGISVTALSKPPGACRISSCAMPRLVTSNRELTINPTVSLQRIPEAADRSGENLIIWRITGVGYAIGCNNSTCVNSDLLPLTPSTIEQVLVPNVSNFVENHRSSGLAQLCTLLFDSIHAFPFPTFHLCILSGGHIIFGPERAGEIICSGKAGVVCHLSHLHVAFFKQRGCSCQFY